MIDKFIVYAKKQFHVDKRLILVYCAIYFPFGLCMNLFGMTVEIAKFTYWFQVFTCYILYMVPISLLLRGLPFHAQYAYGLIAMGFLEFAGNGLETSYAYPDNLLDQFFGIRNFSLALALFFALYFPLGNYVVGKVYDRFFDS